MVIRHDFYIAFTGFIFAGFTLFFGLAFVSGWEILINSWMMPAQLVPFAAIVSFVMAFGALRMMR